MKSVQEISDSNFEAEVLNETQVPVVVDFFATWCGPCNQVAPVFERLASEFEGKMKFLKVNIEDNQHWAAKFNVVTIPTFLFFKSGSMVDRISGALPENELRKMIERVLNS
jgi:thioredoxin 1